MGKFITPTRVNKSLPKDMPDASEAVAQYADGTMFEADDHSLWRLRHARWQAAKPNKQRKPRLVKRAS